MSHSPSHLRADAQESRSRVLHAARELFGEQGLGVATRTVARRAGVSPATLYRHFSSREDLVEAAFASEHEVCVDLLRRALSLQDAWSALQEVVTRSIELNAIHQGVVEVLLAQGAASPQLVARRMELYRGLTALIARAKESGSVHQDVVVGDIVLAVRGAQGLGGGSATERLAIARRFAALMLSSFSQQSSHTALSSPVPLRVLIQPIKHTELDSAY